MNRKRLLIDSSVFMGSHLDGIPYYCVELIREMLSRRDRNYEIGLLSPLNVQEIFQQLEHHKVDWRYDRGLRLYSEQFDARMSYRYPYLKGSKAARLAQVIDGRIFDKINRALSNQNRRMRLPPVDIYHHVSVAPPPDYDFKHQVVTIYDLAYIYFPESHPLYIQESMARLGRAVKEKDFTVIAISESTRRDVIEHWKVREDRVVAVPLATREDLPTNLTDTDVASTLESLKLDGGGRFILSGGSLHPRKNLPRLIAAFKTLTEDATFSDVKLVLAGAKQHGTDSVVSTIASYGLEDRVAVLGYVSNLEMAVLMRECACFAYVSLYEGFGLPIVEAMTLGAPVVTSNTSSMPEVAGDAAVLIDPNDVDAIAHGISRVLSDTDLEQDLRKRSVARAAQFSWKRTADEHIKVYDSLVG